MSFTNTTIVGNATAAPELTTTQGGKQVAKFSVAVSEGKDKPSSFYRVTVWDEMAEYVAATVLKGMRVIVQGRLAVREYEHNGEKRISVDVTAEAVGPDLRFATAQVQSARDRGQGYGQSAPPAVHGGAGAASWGTSVPNANSGAPGASQGDPWGADFSAETAPF